MPKRTKKSPAGKGIAALMLLMMLGAGGFAAYVKLTPQAAHVIQDRKGSDVDVSVQSESAEKPKIQSSEQATSLLIPTLQGSEITLGKPASTPPDGVKPEVSLLNDTLQSLQIDGARAVGIDIQDGVAMVDFNPAIQKGYGSIEEGNLVKSLQMALGQFKGISKFKVIVEGKAIESFGNIELSAGIPVIRPGEAPDKSDSGDKAP